MAYQAKVFLAATTQLLCWLPSTAQRLSQKPQEIGSRVRYGFTPPPIPGVHPRICFNPSELGTLRQRTSDGPAARGLVAAEHVANELADKRTRTGGLGSMLLSGRSLSNAQLVLVAAALRDASFAAYVTGNVNLLTSTKVILLAFIRDVRLSPSLDSSRITPGVAFAYDWMYDSLSPEERNAVRGWIADACVDFQAQLAEEVYGFKPGDESKRNYNWVGYVTGAFGITALAIEGEPGYQAGWYTDAASSMNDFLRNGIGPEGAPVESIHYFAYGMANGAFLLNAMSRRGQAVFNSPNLEKVPLWWTYDLYPWGKDFNDLQDTRDIMMGIEEPFDLLQLAYREDPVMQWVYRNYRDGYPDPQSNTAVALWAAEPDRALDVGKFGLPLSRFFAFNGLAYFRSNWTRDGLYLEFQSDPVLAGPSHAHADRNSFTLAANGNLWITDGGGWLPQDLFHNLVFIDGKAEGYFPQRGRITQYKESEWAAGVVGDAKGAYDWRTDWPNSAGGRLVEGLTSFPYNPVLRATRSLAVVRGEHPYVLVADDIQKDQHPHLYSWQILSPLGNALHVTGRTSGVMTPADLGAYVEPDPTSIRPGALNCSFRIKASGTYNLWLLMGRDYWTPWNWGGSLRVDQGQSIRFLAREGDNSHRHWQLQNLNPSASSKFMPAGDHTLSISTIGTVQFSAFLLAPEVFDALRSDQTPPSSTLVRFAELEQLPKGWRLVPAEPNPGQLAIEILSPSSADLKWRIFDFVRPDSTTYQGPRPNPSSELQISANVETVRPDFRVLLLPRHKNDGMPIIQNLPERTKLQWPDDTTDSITFGSARGDSSIRITRHTKTLDYFFDLPR
jgi:hypothetical protein